MLRDDLQHLGAAFRILRRRADRSQKEIALATGMSRSQVSRYENGMDMPNLTTLARYLDEIGADLSELHKAIQQAKSGTPMSAPDLNDLLVGVLRDLIRQLVESTVTEYLNEA